MISREILLQPGNDNLPGRRFRKYLFGDRVSIHLNDKISRLGFLGAFFCIGDQCFKCENSALRIAISVSILTARDKGNAFFNGMPCFHQSQHCQRSGFDAE